MFLFSYFYFSVLVASDPIIFPISTSNLSFGCCNIVRSSPWSVFLYGARGPTLSFFYFTLAFCTFCNPAHESGNLSSSTFGCSKQETRRAPIRRKNISTNMRSNLHQLRERRSSAEPLATWLVLLNCARRQKWRRYPHSYCEGPFSILYFTPFYYLYVCICI